MKKKVENYIKKRNKTDCEYLTINRYEISHYDIDKGIVGIVDLIEFTQLKKINCENNQIISLINIFDSVEYINCKSNQIYCFNNLPDNLKTLLCDSNQITSLNNLPPGLKFLSCDSNNLNNLDNLPFGLEYLSCGYNPITNLDFLPSGLTKLYLGGLMSKLKSINDLPNSIEEMICTDSLETISKQNFPKGLILSNPQLGIWKKLK